MKKMDELGIPQNVRQASLCALRVPGQNSLTFMVRAIAKVGFMFAQVGNDYGAEQSLRPTGRQVPAFEERHS